MVDFNAIMNRLNTLSNFMNSVISLSKKIFELPASTPGVKLTAVYNETSGVTEQFNLSEALDGVYELTDGMIEFGGITRVDDDFTFGVGFKGRISGVIYETTDPIERTIDGSGTGNHRIDIAVLDDNSDIYIIQGFEVPLADVVVQPTPEPNTLFICSFLIEEDVISEPIFDGAYLFLQKVRIRKGFGNVDTATNEVGDIFQFGISEFVFCDFAIYTGGDINDNGNFNIVTTVEWE